MMNNFILLSNLNFNKIAGFLKSCRNKSQETEDPFWGGGWGFGGAEDTSPSRF